MTREGADAELGCDVENLDVGCQWLVCDCSKGLKGAFADNGIEPGEDRVVGGGIAGGSAMRSMPWWGPLALI